MVREVGEDQKVDSVWKLKEDLTSPFQKVCENE